MKDDDKPGHAALRQMAANIAMIAIDGEPGGLRDLADKMSAVRRNQSTTLPPRVVEAMEGRTVDADVLSAFAMGAMVACEMFAQEACRVKGGFPPSEATAAFVANAMKVVRERGEPFGGGLRYEDDKVTLSSGRGGFDLVVTPRMTMDASTPPPGIDIPSTIVRGGQVVRHSSAEASSIAGHLADLAIRGPKA